MKLKYLQKIKNLQKNIKIKMIRSIPSSGFLLIYPTLYLFWVYKVNEIWFKNNLKDLYPQIFHTCLYRYDDTLSNF